MPTGNAALAPIAETVAHAYQRTRPRARQERIDAEFAKAVKVTDIEPRAPRGAARDRWKAADEGGVAPADHALVGSIGARGVVCDATSTEQVGSLVAEFGEVDVLVNAAGGLPEPASEGLPILEAQLAQWHSSLAQNLLSAVLTTVAVQDKLTSISCVISVGSIGAERRGGSYGAAKAALAAWNTSLSADLAPRGVTCPRVQEQADRITHGTTAFYARERAIADAEGELSLGLSPSPLAAALAVAALGRCLRTLDQFAEDGQ
ncbi:SDR family oxidoreductase [Streptomyces sp. NPDC056910]|uniref:SDR family oxidoreductase n=1 Tax=Streptomyces sp. NPDC056910 TaxID=3345964 RepID=UPI0036CDC302